MKLAAPLVIGLAACGGPAKPVKTSIDAMKDVTTYYIGTSQVWSWDGKTPFGPETETVVQRVVSPLHHQIVETVLINGELSDTTLTQTADEHVFTATVEGDLFTGTLTYTGPTWAPTAWDYDITLADNGVKITGHADITETDIITEKHFFTGDGAERALIREHVHAVSEDEFTAKRDSLLAVTTYYGGTATQWDGTHTKQVGTQAVLRKRMLSRATHEIYESLVLDGTLATDVYVQTEDENVFTLQPHDGLSGTRTLHGPAWAWTSYDDELVAQGATVRIHGEIAADGITSTSTVEVGGAVAAILETSYAVVTEEEFAAMLKAP